MTVRYAVTLSYDGGGFCGWQSQPSGASVQDAVERAIQSLTGETVRVVGSGRTDAGVHAVGQVAHFDTVKDVPEKTIVSGLNAYLPRTVRVLSAKKTDESFDALRSVKKKTYMYLMYRAPQLPVLDGRALCVGELDVASMERAASELVGTHDFATFMASGGGAKTSTRTVFDAHFTADERFIKFFITADGFLYNMVRIIVAQLVKVGEGKASGIKETMEKCDRAYAKEIAPACGLYLYNVEYI